MVLNMKELLSNNCLGFSPDILLNKKNILKI